MLDQYYVITPSTGTIISLGEAKKHLRVDDYQAGVKSSITFGSGNAALVLTAKFDGTYGNFWRAVIIEDGDNTPLSVSYASRTFTINLATDAMGDGTSTVNDVIAALLNDETIAGLITASGGNGTGTGVLAPASLTSFSGGVDGLSYEDDLILTLILGAQARIESILRKKLLNTVMGIKLQNFPGNECAIPLDWGKVSGVESIEYRDRDTGEEEVSSDDYYLENETVPSFIALNPEKQWPTQDTRYKYGITIEFTVGYGNDAEDIPVDIKIALKFIIGHWYTNRESVQVSSGLTGLEVPQGAEWILWPHRDIRF